MTKDEGGRSKEEERNEKIGNLEKEEDKTVKPKTNKDNKRSKRSMN